MYDVLLICDKILLYQNNQFICDSNFILGIQNGRITYLKKHDKKELPTHLKSKKTYHLKNHLISPGFVNTHTHLPMSLFRGLADDLSLKEWLENYIFPLESQFLNKNSIITGTKISAIELIRSGITTCCDMYFYNQDIAETLSSIGLRAVIGIGISKNGHYWNNWKSVSADLKTKWKHHPLISIALGPHAPYTLDCKSLSQIAEFSKKEEFFLVIHVAESLWELHKYQNQYNQTPVQYLHDLGVTGSNSLFVHCVHNNQKDFQIMSETKTALSYNPKSNMKLGNGIAPICQALKEGVVVGLGTDGSASNNNLNFFEEMGSGARLQSLKHKGPSLLTAQKMFQIATIEGAKALGLHNEIGTLELGKKADIIAINLDFISMQPCYNPISNIVYSASGNEVSFVLCEGKVLMENYKLKTIDEHETFNQIQITSRQIKDFLKK